MLLDAKLTSRHTVAEQFVEDGTQGLHYCRVEARGDEPPSDDKTTVRLAELERTTRVLAERVIEPVKVWCWLVSKTAAAKRSFHEAERPASLIRLASWCRSKAVVERIDRRQDTTPRHMGLNDATGFPN